MTNPISGAARHHSSDATLLSGQLHRVQHAPAEHNQTGDALNPTSDATKQDQLISREPFGIPVNVQAAQLASATPKPTAGLQAQLEALDQVQKKINTFDSQQLTGPSQTRLANLTQTLASKRKDIEAELGKTLAERSKKPVLTSKEVAAFHATLDKKIHTEAKYDQPQYFRYRTQGGPGYSKREDADTRYSLAVNPAWSALIEGGKVTLSEKKIISRMSENEGGRTDTLQGYDSEIVSLGAMQKTLNSKGLGELPQQLQEFAQENPEKYKTLFADKGWTVEQTEQTGTAQMWFKDPTDPTAEKITGAKLKTYIHQKDPAVWEKTLSPLLAAGRDADFQQKQIVDYKTRLDHAVNKVPTGAHGKYSHSILAYVTSEQAAALVLDQDVNRPGYVATDFGKALDAFYQATPQASKDPTLWTPEQRQQYEPIVVTHYTQARIGRMTDATHRARHLISTDSGLSAQPGSFIRTPK